MYIILAYDVNCKRVSKINKVCKKHLNVVQRSVFEGDITLTKIERLKAELEKNIIVGEDCVCVYQLDSHKYTSRWEIGMIEAKDRII
ncbi:MAG: CRISPR-associated endonuclease Cas2 [Lachnospiraceae bacterium]|nr:CRISPR-associated endonuclease Cas2 [Lachnospiraceae bacterium]